MKIILSGGGTLGPVVPLLAIAEAYKKNYPQTKFIWVGTKNGPEREIVEAAGMQFIAIGAGKWRRYFSLLNFLDIFKIIIAFFQSLLILVRQKPNLVISAGGFVSVPLHYAAAFLAIPSWVHQQDIEVGFANKLMFPFANKITTVLRDSHGQITSKRAEWIGNPVRDLAAPSSIEARAKFNIPANAPVIFALGGGTGSASINRLIIDTLPQLPRDWHVIHLIGKDRSREAAGQAAAVFSNYHIYQFFTTEMRFAYSAADVVVARAGFATLSELAALKKAAVILPMFGTHQEANARQFAQHDGIILIERGDDSGLKLAQILKDLIEIPQKRQALGDNLHKLLPRANPEKIVEIIQKFK